MYIHSVQSKQELRAAEPFVRPPILAAIFPALSAREFADEREREKGQINPAWP